MEAEIADEWRRMQDKPDQIALWAAAGRHKQAAHELRMVPLPVTFDSPCAASNGRQHLIDPGVVASAIAERQVVASLMRPRSHSQAPAHTQGNRI